MAIYDAVADLPLVVEDHDTERHERTGYGGFERTTTTVALHGADTTGQGEDVTYDADEHEALAAQDGLDGALAPAPVDGHDTVDSPGGEFPRCLQSGVPLVDCRHATLLVRRRQKPLPRGQRPRRGRPESIFRRGSCRW